MFSFFKKTASQNTTLSQGLQQTRYRISQQLRQLTQGEHITQHHWHEMMDLLLISDAGVDTAQYLVEQAKRLCAEQHIHSPTQLHAVLETVCLALLAPHQTTLEAPSLTDGPYTILLIGVNGSGKTTTAAKLAYQYQQAGQSVMLAAGDTFRAAAIEQLRTWGERFNIPVIAQQHGSDSAAVVFDAAQSASAKHIDVLIADTAGRLHNTENLMDELKKIKRVIRKVDDQMPHQTYLVLDGNLGQSSLNQARAFDASVGIDGVIMTKLDGTAKGGALLAFAHHLKQPIVYLGMGEKAEDLVPFEAKTFVQQLLGTPTQ